MSIGDMDVLTDVQREALKEAAIVLTDECLHDPGPWLIDDLPPRFNPFYTGQFMNAFAVCVIVVAWKLFADEHHMLASVAEELALNALINHAKVQMELHDQHPGEEWGAYMDTAFEDLDFEMLWEDDLDGVEVTEIGQQAGVVNLSLRDWFKPFNRRGGVHPFVAEFEPGALKESAD